MTSQFLKETWDLNCSLVMPGGRISGELVESKSLCTWLATGWIVLECYIREASGWVWAYLLGSENSLCWLWMPMIMVSMRLRLFVCLWSTPIWLRCEEAFEACRLFGWRSFFLKTVVRGANLDCLDSSFWWYELFARFRTSSIGVKGCDIVARCTIWP